MRADDDSLEPEERLAVAIWEDCARNITKAAKLGYVSTSGREMIEAPTENFGRNVSDWFSMRNANDMAQDVQFFNDDRALARLFGCDIGPQLRRRWRRQWI